MASTLNQVASALSTLEERHFDNVRRSFRWTDELKKSVTGAIQYYAVRDMRGDENQKLPVICVIGVNYTQGGLSNQGGPLFRYRNRQSPGVQRTSYLGPVVLSVLSAYERNQAAWTMLEPTKPPSPLTFYGSTDALGRLGGVADESFILLIANVSPFITIRPWSEQSRADSERILEVSRPFTHLDCLYDALGSSVDLWIGHSAIPNTRWVWAAFADLVRAKRIQKWLLTFNLSTRAKHLHFERAFRNPKNPRFPWYQPW